MKSHEISLFPMTPASVHRPHRQAGRASCDRHGAQRCEAVEAQPLGQQGTGPEQLMGKP